MLYFVDRFDSNLVGDITVVGETRFLISNIYFSLILAESVSYRQNLYLKRTLVCLIISILIGSIQSLIEH